MKVLITGASSGMGRDMARVLAGRGCSLILTARRTERLQKLKDELSCDVRIICLDLSREEACFELYEQVKAENIDILINNAGFGVYGSFDETDIKKELDMISVNIRAVHILTKLFLRDFKRLGSGYILNVASAAAFLPGPLFSSYYASKAYVLRLTSAIYEELRRSHSGVYIGALCPGPVRTEFDTVAGVSFNSKILESRSVAEYAIEKMFRRKPIIIPGKFMRAALACSRFISEKNLLKISYRIQGGKNG